MVKFDGLKLRFDVDSVIVKNEEIFQHLKNYTQFTCSLLKNGDLIIEKNVTSTKCKSRKISRKA